VLQAVNTPALWLLGLNDHSIPVPTTIDNLKVLAAAGRPFEWRSYPGLDHGLSGSVWDDIGPWLSRFR
jgi:predicted esterase